MNRASKIFFRLRMLVAASLYLCLITVYTFLIYGFVTTTIMPWLYITVLAIIGSNLLFFSFDLISPIFFKKLRSPFTLQELLIMALVLLFSKIIPLTLFILGVIFASKLYVVSAFLTIIISRPLFTLACSVYSLSTLKEDYKQKNNTDVASTANVMLPISLQVGILIILCSFCVFIPFLGHQFTTLALILSCFTLFPTMSEFASPLFKRFSRQAIKKRSNSASEQEATHSDHTLLNMHQRIMEQKTFLDALLFIQEVNAGSEFFTVMVEGRFLTNREIKGDLSAQLNDENKALWSRIGPYTLHQEIIHDMRTLLDTHSTLAKDTDFTFVEQLESTCQCAISREVPQCPIFLNDELHVYRVYDAQCLLEWIQTKGIDAPNPMTRKSLYQQKKYFGYPLSTQKIVLELISTYCKNNNNNLSQPLIDLLINKPHRATLQPSRSSLMRAFSLDFTSNPTQQNDNISLLLHQQSPSIPF